MRECRRKYREVYTINRSDLWIQYIVLNGFVSHSDTALRFRRYGALTSMSSSRNYFSSIISTEQQMGNANRTLRELVDSTECSSPYAGGMMVHRPKGGGRYVSQS